MATSATPLKRQPTRPGGGSETLPAGATAVALASSAHGCTMSVVYGLALTVTLLTTRPLASVVRSERAYIREVGEGQRRSAEVGGGQRRH